MIFFFKYIFQLIVLKVSYNNKIVLTEMNVN